MEQSPRGGGCRNPGAIRGTWVLTFWGMDPRGPCIEAGSESLDAVKMIFSAGLATCPDRPRTLHRFHPLPLGCGLSRGIMHDRTGVAVVGYVCHRVSKQDVVLLEPIRADPSGQTKLLVR